tara:strand:+ start:208 stop:363 length:156 start_codon:yes stop_codon:yes gene_type:complete
MNISNLKKDPIVNINFKVVDTFSEDYLNIWTKVLHDVELEKKARLERQKKD